MVSWLAALSGWTAVAWPTATASGQAATNYASGVSVNAGHTVADGDTIYVNGFPVAANGTLSISGNEGEINTTKYKLSFNGGSGSVYVIRKKYI
jgi:hypothetical protein